MEKNLSVKNLLPPPDSDLSECRPESTRSVSGSPPPPSSSVALDGPMEFPVCCSHAAMGASTEWTNEKHNLYLYSLEISFVKELKHSMCLRDSHPQKNIRASNSSQEFALRTCNSSDKLRVLQDGCLRKTNVQRNETLIESTADSHLTMESPWTCHSRSTGKSCNGSRKMLTSKNFYASARSSEKNLVCHQDLVGSIADVSGQNFVDEDHAGKLRNESIPKRLKRASADVSNNDQVVPLGIFDTKEDVVVHDFLCERKEKGRTKLGLGNHESFISPKSDLLYFLRGS